MILSTIDSPFPRRRKVLMGDPMLSEFVPNRPSRRFPSDGRTSITSVDKFQRFGGHGGR